LIGTLLNEGVGDTIRVSLTADPVLEVKVGRAILNSLGIKRTGIDLISCPTCARCEIDLIPLAEAVETELSSIKEPLTVAVMGCSVNGPGEASEADVGIAAGKGEGLLFSKGKIVKKVPENKLLDTIVSETKKLLKK
jgi:(E)-4-hydroxy-3-methylbut-2-enyl-diphosphate synthase